MQADLYADEVNDDSNRRTIIHSFELEENCTMYRILQNIRILISKFFFQIMDEYIQGACLSQAHDTPLSIILQHL